MAAEQHDGAGDPAERPFGSVGRLQLHGERAAAVRNGVPRDHAAGEESPSKNGTTNEAEMTMLSSSLNWIRTTAPLLAAGHNRNTEPN